MNPTAPTTVLTQESKDVLTRLIKNGARLDNNNNINNVMIGAWFESTGNKKKCY